MSWGELSCKWLNIGDRPCEPTHHTCNKRCKHYEKKGVNDMDEAEKMAEFLTTPILNNRSILDFMKSAKTEKS